MSMQVDQEVKHGASLFFTNLSTEIGNSRMEWFNNIVTDSFNMPGNHMESLIERRRFIGRCTGRN